ncbi:Uncharacterized membrane protein YoaK, UPF0700 family [Lachnospiraceae bacterium NK3A20]|nr:Uncharacterized membrane protein YoaK, UPF0700 family [Lachnospiraceae bacterium NK3A20]
MTYLQKNREFILHLLMTFTAGITGAYAVLFRGTFAQAQTANLIYLFLHLVVDRSPFDVLFRVLSLILFCAGLTGGHLALRKFSREKAEFLCILVEVTGILIAGLIPEDIAVLPAVLPIFALTGCQWSIFNGANGIACSTIFCSNNTKQALFGFVDYLLDRDAKDLRRGLFFLATLISFYAAVTIHAPLIQRFGVRSVWFAFLPLGIAALVCLADSHSREATPAC